MEFGALRGSADGLAPHFHDEVQITCVLAGRRSLLVKGEAVVLSAGQCVCIPAGVPHGSLKEPPGVLALNVYIPAGDDAFDAMVREIETVWTETDSFRLEELGTLIGRGDGTSGRHAVPLRLTSNERVGGLAARAGMSREGFSRMFAKRNGMPPHAFKLAGRLNRARDLLKANHPIADVAAATGFADQSHLTRCFRRAFGITPSRYRRS